MSIIKSNLNVNQEFKIYACDKFLFFFDVKESGECVFLISHDNKTVSELSDIKHSVSETKPEVYVFGNYEFPKINNKYINVKYYKCNINAFIILYSANCASKSNKKQINNNNIIFYNIDTRINIESRFTYSIGHDLEYVINVLGNLEDLHSKHKCVYGKLFKYLSYNLQKDFDIKNSRKMLYDDNLKFLHFSVISETVNGIICVTDNRIISKFKQFIVFKTKYYIIAFENTENFIIYDYNLNELHKFNNNVTLKSVSDAQIEYSIKYGDNATIDQVIDFTDLLKSKNIIGLEMLNDTPNKLSNDSSSDSSNILSNDESLKAPSYDLPPPYADNKNNKEKCVIM